MLQFYLDGIQFALGDLAGPADPRPSGACQPSRAPDGMPASPPAGDGRSEKGGAPAG